LPRFSGIDAELYEAAQIDGASKWQRVWHISLPCIMPTVCIILIMSTGGVLNSNFDQMWLLRNSAVLDTAEVIDTYVYQRAIYDLQYGFGTAIGLFKSVINVLLLLMTNFIVRKLGEESLF
jgi:putative aldouronate transport system permease protein